jgi:UDP-glucose 4-epimerase
VSRFTNVSSESVGGFIFAERAFFPDYVAVDEQHPAPTPGSLRFLEHFGEQLMDAASRPSDLRCITIRPSWVMHPDAYARYLAVGLHHPDRMSKTRGVYVDAGTSPQPLSSPASRASRGTRSSTSLVPTT